MSHYSKWLASLARLSTPPAKVRFENKADDSDYELDLKDALEDADDPPPGTRCSASIGPGEDGKPRLTSMTVPKGNGAAKDAGADYRVMVALVKAAASSSDFAFAQLVPVIQELRALLSSFSTENMGLRTHLGNAQQLAADRGMESIIVAANEKATSVQAEQWDKLLSLGANVADRLITEHSKTEAMRRAFYRMDGETAKLIRAKIGEENFADLGGILFGAGGSEKGPPP